MAAAIRSGAPVVRLEVHGGLCLRIDAGVEMKEMVVDRWRLLAGQRIGADSSVVQAGPDGNAAALPPQAREVCGQPLPLPRAAFGLIEMSPRAINRLRLASRRSSSRRAAKMSGAKAVT